MKVLFATAEAYPLIKTGGLADVSYALPNALRQLNVDIRVLLPGYPPVLDQLACVEVTEPIPLFPHVEPIRLLASLMPDGITPVYIVDCPALFQRDGGPYLNAHGHEWGDNGMRFAVLSKVAALFGGETFLFRPDIVHCNDWQTGLTPAFLAYGKPPRARSVLSLHNAAYQGNFPPDILNAIDLPVESFALEGLEFHGMVSFLKAGLYYADWLTTVSPSYAQEIQTVDFGQGMHGLLSFRHEQLSGILNGIDDAAWNPSTDSHLPHHYSATDLAGKTANRHALRQRLSLADAAEKPLFSMITRLAHQKGVDLLLPLLPGIVQRGGQVAILGSGEPELEHGLRHMADRFPDHISVTIGYNEALAHQIEAGADGFIMPSRFEPCGLNQMYSMRYGTLPIVRHTGGLADTVVDATPEALQAQRATGFVFDVASSDALWQAIDRALTLFYDDKSSWQQMQLTGMQQDFSWRHSAQQYLDLYQRVLR